MIQVEPVANWSLVTLNLIRMAIGVGVLSLTATLPASPLVLSDPNSDAKSASALMAAGNAEEAVPLYRNLVARFPNEPSFGINFVLALFQTGRYREGIEECDALAKRWPANTNLRILLADALSTAAQWAEAADQYEVCARAQPNNPRVVFGMARSYESLVWQSASQMVSVAPNSAELLALSAELELEQGRLAPAFQQFRKALDLQPSFPGLHVQIAEIYKITGHTDWAALERAKEARPAPCATGSAECAFAAGQFRKIAAEKADSAQAVYWQAKAFLELSRKAYQHLRELPPSKEGAEAKAINEEKHSRYPEAAASWKSALRFDPSDQAIQRHLATALCQGNNCETAIPYLKKQLVQQPESAEVNYLYGLALNNERKPDEAVPYLEKAVRLNDKFLPARASLGEAYLEAGNPERAIPELRAAAAYDETGSRIYQLARAYQAAGKREEAADTLRDYRQVSNRHAAEVQANSSSITPP